jgi:hypothetical protein
MTNFLHWRKMTWALVLGSAVLFVWMAVTLSASLIVLLFWLGGMVLVAFLWLVTQPLVHQGRGLRGVFVRPGWSDWRVVNLHRTYPLRKSRRHVG